MSTTRPLALDEFLKLPEEEPALEFADGEISQKMSPKGHHSALQAEFLGAFNRYGRAARLARAFPELRVTFAGASRVPDVAVFRWERIPRAADGSLAQDIFVAPDLVVEIASPGQSITALVRRCLWYVQEGVAVALLVDPEERSVLAFYPNRQPKPLGSQDMLDLRDVFPDCTLDLAEIFAALNAD